MWPYSWTHVGTPSHLGHMDRVAATMPSQAHAGAAQEAPNIGQWEGQDVPLVRPSSCTVKGGIPSSRRYIPTYLFICGLFRGAHKSLEPRARTLLGGLGQATLSFFAVATLLFVFIWECPKFCDLAKQRRKIVGGVSEVGKDDFSLFFSGVRRFLRFFFHLLRSRDAQRCCPSQQWKTPPPGDALPPPPQRATPARKSARCGPAAESPRPHRPHPGHTGRRTPAARPRGRAAGGGTAPRHQTPLTTVAGHPPRGPPPATPAAHSPDRACRPGGQCWAPTPTHRHPQHVGGGPQQPAQWAGRSERGSA